MSLQFGMTQWHGALQLSLSDENSPPNGVQVEQNDKQCRTMQAANRHKQGFKVSPGRVLWHGMSLKQGSNPQSITPDRMLVIAQPT